MKYNVVLSVLPCNVVHSALDHEEFDEEDMM